MTLEIKAVGKGMSRLAHITCDDVFTMLMKDGNESHLKASRQVYSKVDPLFFLLLNSEAGLLFIFKYSVIS